MTKRQKIQQLQEEGYTLLQISVKLDIEINTVRAHLRPSRATAKFPTLEERASRSLDVETIRDCLRGVG